MSAIIFPENGYVGVAAKFAQAYSECYESPKEFFYFDFLTLVGATLSGRFEVDIDLPCQPRFYTIKIAPSAWKRKSTSTTCADNFIKSAELAGAAQVLYGAGSAEGIASWIGERHLPNGDVLAPINRRAVLYYDEYRRFEAKAGIQNSALRPLVNELYERNQYDNITKTSSIRISDGHLSLISNTTTDNYERMLDAEESAGIGLLNRLFLVTGTKDKKVARPRKPPESVLGPIREELRAYFERLPALDELYGAPTQIVRVPLTPEADRMWDEWYLALPETDETARLDNLGMRLMGLLAFTCGKPKVDAELLQSVLAILGYERQVRSTLKPLDAENSAARHAQRVVRTLENRGPLSARDVEKFTNARRVGPEIHRRVVTALLQNGQVAYRDRRYSIPEEEAR
jgi:Protein of unknown function (DUF3987)